jgi:carbon monoxide dehydrogenase subunit G
MLAKLIEMMGVAIDDVQQVPHCMPGLNSVLHTLSSSLLARALLGP